MQFPAPRRAFLATVTAAACALCAPAHSQQWPSKPIRLVVANSAGAATDVAGRVFADQLARRIGTAVAVDNRPGGDGMIGAQAVVSSAPDGYTLFFASQSTVAIDPALHKSMPFDPVRDFTALAVVCDDTGPTAIFAHPSLPFANLPGMIEYARANPGKLAYGTTVPLFQMLGEWLERRANIKWTEVRYKTTPQATQDALGGVVPIYITAYGPMEQNVKAGKLRVLAVTVRQSDIRQIPTVADTFPDFSMLGSIFLLGPAKIPADIAQRINAITDQVVKDPKFNEQLKPLRWQNLEGARSLAGTVDYIRVQRERWGKFIEETGRKPE
jgi:tripartite-type tricarboxylate transporter receptor subunit TctC